MTQGRARQEIGKRAETADGKALAFGLLHRLEVRLRVELKRHEVTDTPKVFDVDTRGPTADSLDERAAHDLHVTADKRLQIGRAGIKQHEEDVKPFIFEKTFGFGDVHR